MTLTIQNALDQRIPRIRRPNWANPNCYLRLPLLADGTYGPWAELYDEWGQKACEVRVGSQHVCVVLPDVVSEDGYEIYTGPVSESEQDPLNYAKSYLES